MNHFRSASLLALALAGLVSGVPQAQTMYSGSFNTGSTDGVVGPGLTGFDIYSNGSAAFYCFQGAGGAGTGCGGNTIAPGTQLNPLTPAGGPGSIAQNDIVRTVYQGVALRFNPAFVTAALDFPGQVGTYQITVAADFLDIASLISIGLPAVFTPLSGQVGLFYDSASFAGTFVDTVPRILGGIGYTDGLMIAHGVVGPSVPTAIVCDGGNTVCVGSSNLSGLLNTAVLGNNVTGAGAVVGFFPLPGDFHATTTIQKGGGIALDYETVCFFGTGAIGSACNVGTTVNGFTAVGSIRGLTERADANVDLSVPEPASLALFGIALASFGFARRRRAS